MDLQDIFPCERIIDAKELSPGYDSHASDVWHIKTEKREVVIRASKIREGNVKRATSFFKSLYILFGIDPSNVFALESVNNTLNSLNAFVYPKIFEKRKIDREYIVVEFLRGSTLGSFIGLSDNELGKFGGNLAKIHGRKMDYFGNPAGTFKIEAKNVNSHIIRSMKEIVNEFYSGNRKIIDYLPQMERILLDMPAWEHLSFVLVDIDPSQFLADNGSITGLVDTEAYVIAPRELDFIALEYVLDKRSAELISDGYKNVLPMPDLNPVRTVCRYLYRLIDIQGIEDIDEWFLQPALF